MNVISIQSQVAFGHVGNSAAVFPMQLHGIDVIAVPTTLLSNRPGYPSIRGRVLDLQGLPVAGAEVRVASAFHNVGAANLHSGGKADCDVLVVR